MRKPSALDYDFSKLGRKIQIRRKELGLTQEQLAEKIDCSLTHLSRIEGGSRPSLESLIRISVLLGYSLDELTGLEPSQNPYTRELCDLLLEHSTEDQKIALHVLRHFFHIIDQVESRNKRKSLEHPLPHSTDRSDELTPKA